MTNVVFKFVLVCSEGEQTKVKKTRFMEFLEITPEHRQAAILSRLQNVATEWEIELDYPSIAAPKVIKVQDYNILLFENTYKSVSDVVGIGVTIFEEVWD